MTRVVIDTSVLIRYLIKPSAAVRRLVEDLWLNGDVVMVSSPELIAELEDVLARDYIRALIRPEEGKAMLDAIRATAEILPPLDEVPVYTRDPKDDKFLACAGEGRAFTLYPSPHKNLTRTCREWASCLFCPPCPSVLSSFGWRQNFSAGG